MWRVGTLTRFFDPAVDKKYGALYNYDVQFSDQRGPCGVKLENHNYTIPHSAQQVLAAVTGDWFIVQQISGQESQ